MGLRPARTCRYVRGHVWARISRRKPRKSYVKGAPHPKVRQYNMGVDKRYDLEVTLVAQRPMQLRDNCLEAGRQAANKFLEKNIFQNFFLQVSKYPHLVLREHSALGVAGADRISKGMKLAFGRPKGRLARLKNGDAVFTARVYYKDLNPMKDGLIRAARKLGGGFKIVSRDISKDPINLARKEHVFKTKEEPKPVAAAATAVPAAGTAPGAQGAAAPEVQKAGASKK
ncbi:50S ribosomal protein L16 [Candidatus Micrarchaeota archaeon]|nr:50S ribosomal protein L16 [Candidatus Micrarchaeota archaeon]